MAMGGDDAVKAKSQANGSESTVSQDILNVVQSGQVKASTGNMLSLLMGSSDDDDEEEAVEETSETSETSEVEKPRGGRPVAKTSNARKGASARHDYVAEDGLLSDGFDGDLYGDAEDRARLASLTEVEREAILYERAQTRQARIERRALEQKVREREELAQGLEPGSRRGPSAATDLKRRRLDELKAKRQWKQRAQDDEEEGEFSDDESEDDHEQRAKKPTKGRRARRHRRDSDDDEQYSASESDEEDAKSQQRRQKAAGHGRPVTSDEEDVDVEDAELDLDCANKLRLSRDILAQWVYREGFESVVQHGLLRINIGSGRTGTPVYRVVELRRIVPYHRTYMLKDGTPTDLAALLRFAKSERIFKLDIVSNSPFTETEFMHWRAECSKTGVKLPYTLASARRKINKLKAFHAEPLTDAVIAAMISRRKQLLDTQSAPRNLLAEQTILQQQLREALERGNDEEVSRIDGELAAISQRKDQSAAGKEDRLAGMSDLNRRNRLANLETGRQAEIARLQMESGAAKMADGVADGTLVSSFATSQTTKQTLDPFQRRKCKPTIIHMSEETAEPVASPVSQPTPTAAATAITRLEQTKSQDLFDAHDFELDLDI